MEDPVTGSVHYGLVPLWQTIIHKSTFLAKQLSERGGTLYCQYGAEQIIIASEAVLVYKGERFQIDVASLRNSSASGFRKYKCCCRKKVILDFYKIC